MWNRTQHHGSRGVFRTEQSYVSAGEERKKYMRPMSVSTAAPKIGYCSRERLWAAVAGEAAGSRIGNDSSDGLGVTTLHVTIVDCSNNVVISRSGVYLFVAITCRRFKDVIDA